MDCTAYLVRIVDIWGEITSFVQTPAARMQWDSNSPLIRLKTRTMAWEEALPAHLHLDLHLDDPLHLHGLRPRSITNHARGPPLWYIMHIFHHISLYILNRFSLPKMRGSWSVDHIPKPFLDMCVKETIANARQISEIISLIVSSGVTIVAPFVGFACFAAGIMHSQLGYHSLPPGSELAQRHREYVGLSLEFLRRLAGSWKPIAQMFVVLEKSIARTRRSISQEPALYTGWFTEGATHAPCGESVLDTGHMEDDRSDDEADDAADLLVYLHDSTHRRQSQSQSQTQTQTQSQSQSQIPIALDYVGNQRERSVGVAGLDILGLLKRNRISLTGLV